MSITQRSALVFIILLGLVSFFSDMVYEGARSITGPLFSTLGASGAVVGFVAGFGEFIGNALRIVSGFLVDRTSRYWLITFIGYTCVLAIPLLAFAHTWKIAAALIIIERIGKAIRAPARDAMLSYATHKMGRGVGFGLHQIFDQIGGMMGPLLMIGILFIHQQYSMGFILLFIPAVISLSMLGVGKHYYSDPRYLEKESFSQDGKIPRIFWIYLIAAGLMAAGFADYPLIAFHFQKMKLMSAAWIPAFYMIAMGVSAISAMTFGWIYDRIGVSSLIIGILLSSLFAPFVFEFGFIAALFGMILWGIGMGAQKSLLKAIVADMVSKKTRGLAYGIFNSFYGVMWFAGSWVMGVLYDRSIHGLVVFSVVAELLAVPFIVWMLLRMRSN